MQMQFIYPGPILPHLRRFDAAPAVPGAGECPPAAARGVPKSSHASPAPGEGVLGAECAAAWALSAPNCSLRLRLRLGVLPEWACSRVPAACCTDGLPGHEGPPTPDLPRSSAITVPPPSDSGYALRWPHRPHVQIVTFAVGPRDALRSPGRLLRSFRAASAASESVRGRLDTRAYNFPGEAPS